MKLKYFPLLALVLIEISALFISCSVEKRKYTSGYHIDWNNKKASLKQSQDDLLQTEEIKKKSLPDFIQPISNITSHSVSNDCASSSKEKKKIILPGSDISKILERSVTRNNIEKQNKIVISDNPIKEHPVRLNRWSLFGFIIGVLGVPLVLLLVGTLFGITGIIFSAIGLRQCNKHGDEFRGRGLAIAGLILGIIALFFGTIILYLLFSGLA